MSGGAGVPTALHVKTRAVMATRRAWLGLAALETRVVSDELRDVSVRHPVYVTGLARAGTTIVTELLAEHPDLTSHRYADFPFLFTPYWRNYLARRARIASPQRQPRAHNDRIEISLDSPEAFEEVLWMAFDRDLHYRRPAGVVQAGEAPAGFAAFYRDHLRKLLAVRGSDRYLAKGNYNLLRVPWLLDQSPDASVIVVVRRPLEHVASLCKQHRLFTEAQAQDRRTARQLAFSGHFEFGPQRRATAFAGEQGAREVEKLWAADQPVRGWARLWSQAYGLLLRWLADPALAPRIHVIRYEDLCGRSETTLDALGDHAQLGPRFAPIVARYAKRLTPPDYYQPNFSASEHAAIAEESAEVAGRLGYDN